MSVVGYVGPLSAVGSAAGYGGNQVAVVATAAAGADTLIAVLCRVAQVCSGPVVNYLNELALPSVELSVSVGTAPMTLRGALVIDGVVVSGRFSGFAIPSAAQPLFTALGIRTLTGARISLQLPRSGMGAGVQVSISVEGDNPLQLTTTGAVAYPVGAGGAEPEAVAQSSVRIDSQLFTLNQLSISTKPQTQPIAFTVSSVVTVRLGAQPLTFVVSATYNAGAQLLLTGYLVGTWENVGGINGLTICMSLAPPPTPGLASPTSLCFFFFLLLCPLPLSVCVRAANAGLQLGLSPAAPTGVAVSAFGVWGDFSFGPSTVQFAVLVSPVARQYVLKVHATALSLGSFVQFIGQATKTDLAGNTR